MEVKSFHDSLTLGGRWLWVKANALQSLLLLKRTYPDMLLRDTRSDHIYDNLHGIIARGLRVNVIGDHCYTSAAFPWVSSSNAKTTQNIRYRSQNPCCLPSSPPPLSLAMLSCAHSRLNATVSVAA